MDFNALFNPTSIAVVGASRDPNKIGSAILKNLRITYRGKIFPINPFTEELQGVKTYKNLGMVKEPIDVAVIAVPANGVLGVLKQAEKKGVKFAVIISAGFKEVGPEGAKREEEIKRFLVGKKMRVIGPNCLGIMNMDPPYNATFIDPIVKPLEGNAAIISQSGAIMSAMIDAAIDKRIGFSKMISVGNAVDVDEAELVHALTDDPNTNAIFLYLEGLINGREFLRAAAKASETKPLLILKGGISTDGSRAVISHTGSLSGDNTVYEAAFKRVGAIKVKDMETALLLLRDAPKIRIKSNEIVILTNGGGNGILATDSLSETGLTLAKYNNNTIKELERVLPRGTEIGNPLDIRGDASQARYRDSLKSVARMNKPVIVLFSPQEVAMPIETAKEIINVSAEFSDVTILAAFMGGTRVEKSRLLLLENMVPVYSFPDEPVKVVDALYKYGLYRPPSFSTYEKTKISITKLSPKTNLFGLKAATFLKGLGIDITKGVYIKGQKDAKAAIKEIGFPCVLKIYSGEAPHKNRIGGVVTNIINETELNKAFGTIAEAAKINKVPLQGYELYKHIENSTGIEIILGGHKDKQFGTVVGIGVGGVNVEAINQMFHMIAPITDEDVNAFKESGIAKIVAASGSPQAVNTLIDSAIRLAKIMDKYERITDIDINPVVIKDNTTSALDLKIFVRA